MLGRLIRNWRLIYQLLRGKRHPFLHVESAMRLIRNGKVVWEGKGGNAWWNGLQDEGEENLLDAYFRNQNAPTTFYLGLGHISGSPDVPADSDTLATINEISGDGYARVEITRDTNGFPTLSQDGATGDWYVSSKTCAFTNTGSVDWDSVDYIFLTDVASGTSGKLLVTAAASASKVVSPGDELDANFEQIRAS